MSPNSFLPQEGFLSGQSPLARDRNGVPIHGLIYRDSWRALSPHEFSLDWAEGPKEKDRRVKIRTKFELTQKSLVVRTSVRNKSISDICFALGYHPYFRLPEGKATDWILKFGASFQEIPLGPDLMPLAESKSPSNRSSLNNTGSSLVEKRDFWEVKVGERAWDHLFYFPEGIRIQLLSESGKDGIQIESDTFCYLQIYLFLEKNCIALEPMSGPGNFENNAQNEKCCLNFEKEIFFKFSITNVQN
jgi:galactose mutarotase-like enzyme